MAFATAHRAATATKANQRLPVGWVVERRQTTVDVTNVAAMPHSAAAVGDVVSVLDRLAPAG
jgi:hypothetical protein